MLAFFESVFWKRAHSQPPHPKTDRASLFLPDNPEQAKVV